ALRLTEPGLQAGWRDTGRSAEKPPGAPPILGRLSHRAVYSVLSQRAANMRLSIRDEEIQRLARELAERTGETVTHAVGMAIRERLDRIRREQGESLAGQLLAIGRDCAARLKEPFRSGDHGDLLYD